MEIFIWGLIAFLSASIPWSLLLGFLSSRSDVRSVGDKNPGGANVLKMAGWKVGLTAIFVDIGKAFLPVYVAIIYTDLQSWPLVIVSLSCLLGSIFTPFLKFKGGKSLGVTCGIWAAISSGMIIPMICILMALAHLIQKTHIWTIIVGFLGILSWVLIFDFRMEYVIFWIINFLIVMMKHRKEFDQRIIFRDWILGLRKVQ